MPFAAEARASSKLLCDVTGGHSDSVAHEPPTAAHVAEHDCPELDTCHDCADVSPAVKWPAKHSLQALEFVAAAIVPNLPAAQPMQTLDEFAPTSPLYLPATQLSQELDPASLKVPAPHATQTLGLAAATVVLNLPAAQLSQSAAIAALNVPAEQSVHVVAPSSAASVSKLHQHRRWFVEELAVHDTLPLER